MKTLSNFLSNRSLQEEDRGCRKNAEGGTHEEEPETPGPWPPAPQEGAGTVMVFPRDGEGRMRGTLGVPGQVEHQTGGKGSSVGCAGAYVVNADRAWVPQCTVIVDVTGAQHSYRRLSDGGSLVVLLGLCEPTTPTFRASLAGGRPSSRSRRPF